MDDTMIIEVHQRLLDILQAQTPTLLIQIIGLIILAVYTYASWKQKNASLELVEFQKRPNVIHLDFERGTNKLKIKNIGNGYATNIHINDINHFGLKFSFEALNVLGPGMESLVEFQAYDGEHPKDAAFLAPNLYKSAKYNNEICIRYENIDGITYETLMNTTKPGYSTRKVSKKATTKIT